MPKRKKDEDSNIDEDEGRFGRGDEEEGETEDVDVDEEVEAEDGVERDDGGELDEDAEADEEVEEVEDDEAGLDRKEVNVDDEGDYEGEPDGDGADEEDGFDEEDGVREDWKQESNVDRDYAKTSQKKTERNSDSSESSGGHSKSSFDESRKNRENMKPLQSSVRDHELPLRIAYEQLDELAANAEKVKTAIEKNRSILNVQVKKSDSRYLRAAFAAWKLELDWQKSKRRDSICANAWRRKSLMLRAFKAWGRDHTLHGKAKRLEKSAVIILQRHNMRRCWKAWVALIKEKLRDQVEHRKEKRLVKDLDYKYQEKLCRRACNFMYRYRLRRKFLAFRDGCKVSRLQDQWEDGMERQLARRKLKRLFQGWRRESRARLQKRTAWQFFKAWLSVVGDKRSRAENLEGLSFKNSTNKRALAFAAWAGLVQEKKANAEKLRRATLSADLKMLKNAFDGFVDGCSESKRQGNIERRALKRMQAWRLNKAFQSWICFMQIQAQKKMARLQEHVVTVEKENDRLRVENERLAHVIDSGNWGKERVSELIQAGQVLTGERDALTRLLGRMQRQHSFALDQQRHHEEEIQELKTQLMGKVSKKHLVRNKLLVKGASSFNSLIKAMKEDVLRNGSDPELLYTIDKLAMDEVTVFPDGDLRVKPMGNFERGKGNWSHDTGPGSSPHARSSPRPILPAPATPIRSSSPTTKSFRARTPLRTRSSDNETKSLRSQTPVRTRSSDNETKSLRSQTPVKTRSRDNEIPPSQSSLNQSSKPALVTAIHKRLKTPMRGRPSYHFDYDQKTRGSDQEGPAGIRGSDQEVVVTGPHSDV